jgi:glycosyltransferase involved in cell wall biosynthesis
MLFSLLIAQYNNGCYFKDCYDSIIAQTYTDWEVIIVDDCSTDNSVDIIQEIIGEDKRFKLYQNEQNMGCGYTKNRCVALANGEICGFLDPDDAITPDAVALMIKAHRENPDAALVHSVFYYCDEQLIIQSKHERAGFVKVGKNFTNLDAKVNHFAAFKKSSYFQTEGIDITLQRAVDQDLYLKLSEVGEFIFIDKPLYKYRIHNRGISTGDSNGEKAFFYFLKVIAKAEQRRQVNLEKEVAAYLSSINQALFEQRVANPRYLILKFIEGFKSKPKAFLKRLFLNR